MKTKKQIIAKARRIRQMIFELRDEVINAQNSEISDIYRGYLMGTEFDMAIKYEQFENQLTK